MSGDPILVWRFEEAPEEYQRLSDHFGDEDWIAFIPDTHKESQGSLENIPTWMEGGPFGCVMDPTIRKVTGGKIVIGAHA